MLVGDRSCLGVCERGSQAGLTHGEDDNGGIGVVGATSVVGGISTETLIPGILKHSVEVDTNTPPL
jgi:hypothetical protein